MSGYAVPVKHKSSSSNKIPQPTKEAQCAQPRKISNPNAYQQVIEGVCLSQCGDARPNSIAHVSPSEAYCRALVKQSIQAVGVSSDAKSYPNDGSGKVNVTTCPISSQGNSSEGWLSSTMEIMHKTSAQASDEGSNHMKPYESNASVDGILEKWMRNSVDEALEASSTVELQCHVISDLECQEGSDSEFTVRVHYPCVCEKPSIRPCHYYWKKSGCTPKDVRCKMCHSESHADDMRRPTRLCKQKRQKLQRKLKEIMANSNGQVDDNMPTNMKEMIEQSRERSRAANSIQVLSEPTTLQMEANTEEMTATAKWLEPAPATSSYCLQNGSSTLYEKHDATKWYSPANSKWLRL